MMTTKDAYQKEILCRHFAAQGWYVRPEVLVFHREGIRKQQMDITDIDVLALQPGADLRWRLVLGDCKTLRGQSPVNRSIWLRGLIDHFSGSAGIIILKRGQGIETDHKLFAASLGITLLEESEFKQYDRALVYPDGTAGYPISLEDLTLLRELPRRYPALHPISEYIHVLAWNEANRLELLRKVLGETQAAAKEIDPAKPEHLALVLDIAGVFAIGLAECVGTIFNQYLQPGTFEQLDDALKMVIWGGRSQYNFISRLRRDLVVAKGKTTGPESELALPAWDRFLQLVRNMLEYPGLAFRVPQLLQLAAIDIYRERSFLSHATSGDLLLLKYSMLTTDYLCHAANLPPQTRRLLEDQFVKLQSAIIHSNSSNKVGQHTKPQEEDTESLSHQQLEMKDLKEPSNPAEGTAQDRKNIA